jgi:hypothetical protein
VNPPEYVLAAAMGGIWRLITPPGMFCVLSAVLLAPNGVGKLIVPGP